MKSFSYLSFIILPIKYNSPSLYFITYSSGYCMICGKASISA